MLFEYVRYVFSDGGEEEWVRLIWVVKDSGEYRWGMRKETSSSPKPFFVQPHHCSVATLYVDEYRDQAITIHAIKNLFLGSR
jgi:hypothetical protein